MKPFKHTIRQLRALFAVAGDVPERSRIMWRPGGVAAANAHRLLIVPLEHDPERDFQICGDVIEPWLRGFPERWPGDEDDGFYPSGDRSDSTVLIELADGGDPGELVLRADGHDGARLVTSKLARSVTDKMIDDIATLPPAAERRVAPFAVNPHYLADVASIYDPFVAISWVHGDTGIVLAHAPKYDGASLWTFPTLHGEAVLAIMPLRHPDLAERAG